MEVRRQLGKSLLVGAAAGFAATLPMSAVMLVGQQVFPRSEKRLPPKEITMRLLRATLVKFRADDAGSHALATASHFAYGATVGAMYAPLAQACPIKQPVATGATYGLLVWAASYLGWLPSVGLRWSATRDSAEKNITMILAHLVWGSVLGALTDRWTRRFSRRPPRGFATAQHGSHRIVPTA